ncbi:MAG: hypothetical protein FD170_565 [Bacteroidetes bacterium]|nr:MAG: hypothetical protein FD170_565 [Bacteroidota bacterium]
MKTNPFTKPICIGIAAIASLFNLSLISNANAQEYLPDRPGVPYFETPGDVVTENLPLQSTTATVSIAGVIAHVTVKQVYKNQGKKPIEAVYVFPGSTRAAVHAMSMKIGERNITAKIEERNKARTDYAQALNEGRSASLLEQHRPNVFQMSVGNIMPGDVVEVELRYTEYLMSRNGIYEFVYPTVVGPRYPGNGESSHNPEWNANPYLNEGELPSYTFNFDCSISSGLPLKDVRCTSHKVNVTYKDKKSAGIQLDSKEIYGANRDFILQYRLGGDGIENGIWLYSDGVENYFMTTIQPPASVKPEMIPPREYIFIVDVSGSMHGFPLEVSKKLISGLLNGLKSTDRFNILFFAGGADLLANESLSATTENISKALKMLSSQRGSGGTELLPALKKALAMNTSSDFARTFVIATDGYVTVEKEAFALIKSNLNKANFFTFGIGSSVNRHLLEGMAHAGAGEAVVITNEKEAVEKAEEFRKLLSSPLLTNIDISFNGFDAYDFEPSSVPDMFASRPVVIFGKYRGTPSGSIKLSGSNGDGNYTSTISVADAKPVIENQALKYLWAREKIRVIDDYSGGYGGVPEEVEKLVTSLGIKYNLLTAYTSFIAIDTEIRNDGKPVVTVRQPLPLPEGVSNCAVGAVSTGASSPKMSMGYAVQDVQYIEGIRVTGKKEMKEEEAFIVVETMPSFPGGQKALENYLKINLKYPEAAKNAGIKGTVFVSFVVERDGTLSDIRVVRGIGSGCDEEVIRLLKNMPKWKPGKQRGKAVRVSMNLPVTFDTAN